MDTNWQEVLVYLAGILERPDPFVRDLLPINPVLAARGVHDGGAQVEEATRLEVINALRDCFEDASKPSYREDLRYRIEAGELLGWLGDTRFALLDLHTGEYVEDELLKVRIWRGEEDPERYLILPPMVTIPPTEEPFLMGSTLEDLEAYRQQIGQPIDGEWVEAEQPAHRVALGGYRLAGYPVTYREFEVYVRDGGAEPGYGWNDPRYHRPSNPVIGVNWHRAVAYAEWLNKKIADFRLPISDLPEPVGPFNRKSQIANRKWGEFRLPTEAEWEYAARGKARRLWPWGKDVFTAESVQRLCNIAHGENAVHGTTPVGIYPLGSTPDGMHVYDLSGNVWEWCSDWYDEGYYQTCEEVGTVKNPPGPDTGEGRVLRGGSWLRIANGARPTNRYWGELGLK